MNKDLTKLNIKSIYSDSTEVKNFYSKVLSNASIYKRITAYFTIGVFKYLKKGLVEFLKNDGYMQLIMSIDIDKETYQIIKKGYNDKTNHISSIANSEIIEKVKELCNQEEKDLFLYLISVGKLDIRFVYKSSGIVHDKFGIVSDGIHNLIYIGSNNLTEASIATNDEAFTVTIDWDNPSKRELEQIENLNTIFDSMWNNSKEDVVTIALPDETLEELIDSTDYNEVIKYVSNPNYIRLDINENRELILTSNINISEYLNYSNLGEFSSNDFLSYDGKRWVLKNVERIAEIYLFKKIMY